MIVGEQLLLEPITIFSSMVENGAKKKQHKKRNLLNMRRPADTHKQND